MSSVGEQVTATGGYPHLHGCVSTGRSQAGAIRRPAYTAHYISMSPVGKTSSERDGGISEKCLDGETCSCHTCHACQPNQHRTSCESASPSSRIFDVGLREGIFVG